MDTVNQIVLWAQSAASGADLWSFFDFNEGQRFVIIIVAIGCFTAIVVTLGSIVAALSNSLHRRRSEFDLKREMLDRGMSADEIAKVIDSATPPEDGFGRWVATWGKNRK